ncbi:oxidoreductase [Pseudoalteromonas translucida]|uniref:Electron acceptor reductase/NADH oxidase, FAD binding, iron-sulfur cluster binding site n=1 Tax=Pseudoalteromonas translucida (strain TAC 125) TaxID=326442 RepID=Q3IE73_PSET1|nr:FAD-dependent oxidoreductase [Pseudoalteromonas translucida]CAI85973.1 putative electron acceptor reductase/NADH oxidase, FAD binding, iron-sulfur cluster binding site [Pseudoalteromonas translucida]
MSHYQHLLKPGKVGGLTLRNRIMMAPMGSNYADPDGHCSERIQAFYEARAKGGVGLITMGSIAIAFPAGTAEPYQVGISKDEFIPGLKALTERVHKHGAKIAVQLQHAGKTAVRDLAEGRELWVPSLPPAPPQSDIMQAVTPTELSTFVRPPADKPVTIKVMEKADIVQMVEWFAAAAKRAQQAGFDAIELHSAHSYILAGFLSSYYNKRDDEYGGSIENRARLLLEVIAAIRERVGQNFPLWVRLDAHELNTPGGITLEDCIAVSKMVEQAGVNAVSISAYATLTTGSAFTAAPLVHKPAGFLDWAAAVKKEVSIPVIAVGRLEPDIADAAIASGKCDFIAMGRKLLADPELPNKLTADREADIRPCIYCYVCVSQVFINQRVKCAVNAATGKEFELKVIMTDKPKHIVVVGGGPAGIEAAVTASERGHKVTLLERSKRLGGTLFFAALAYPENGKLLDYHLRQLAQSKVTVKLNTTATPKLISTLNADEVFVATGASRGMPDIQGCELSHVWSGEQLRQLLTGEVSTNTSNKLTALQRLMLGAGNTLGLTKHVDKLQRLSHLWMPLGKRVTIVGGGLVGLELAEFLAERGREVTVIEAGRNLGIELSIVRRWRVLDHVRQLGVTLITQADVTAIDTHAVHYKVDEQPRSCLADTVVMATGITTDNSLTNSLIAAGHTVKDIGDCNDVAYIEGAISAGYKAGLSC